MELIFLYRSEPVKIKVGREGRAFRVVLPDGTAHLVQADWEAPSVLRLEIGERRVRIPVWHEGDQRLISWGGLIYSFERETQRRPRAVHHSSAEGVLTAPMPGMIVKVFVREGEQVHPNQRLLVLEAMKTEQAVFAPFEGKVSRIHVKEGQIVAEGTSLVEMGREE